MFLEMWKKFMPVMEPDGAGGTGGTGDDGENGSGGGEEKDLEKKFTQEDLNRIGAKEKRSGQNSMLKALGFETEEEAKAYLETKRKEDNDKKDDVEKAKEAEKAANAAKTAAEAKATLLEKKFKVVSLGVAAEKVDDIVTLANAKATDGKTFEDAIEELKKSYPELFNASNSKDKGGTGGNANPPRGKGGNGESSIGKRLAEARKTLKSDTKNSYFKTN